MTRQILELVPPIAREKQIGRTQAEADSYGTILSKLGFGVVILDEYGCVLRCNCIAEQVFPDDLKIGRRFPFSPVQRGLSFESVLRNAADAQSVLIEIQLDFKTAPVLITTDTSAPGERGYIVLIEQRALTSATNLSFLTTQYRLTKTERQIVEHLMNGLVPKQVARCRNVSVSTVRTQIKNILIKTGTTSISSLILLVARLPRLFDTELTH